MKTFKTKAGTELPLMDLRGKDYLQAAWRLVWFREEHPLWTIETEALSVSSEASFFKASVKDETGRTIATGHKTETVKGFADHTEKCETGAIARALAACGYGTQFAPEMDEGERLADSPTAPRHAEMAQVMDFPQKPPSALSESTNGSLDACVCPFGKNKGKTFKEVGKPALANDRAYWLAKLREKDEEPKGRLKQFLEEINAYL